VTFAGVLVLLSAVAVLASYLRGVSRSAGGSQELSRTPILAPAGFDTALGAVLRRRPGEH
jgi:hypothetical protein